MAKKRGGGRKPPPRRPGNGVDQAKRRVQATKIPQVRPVITETAVSYQKFSGPLPTPEMLAEYDQVHPGLAERIIRTIEIPLEMAQEQQVHRHALEDKVIRSDLKRSWAGLVLGFLIVMAAILGGIWLISEGHSGQGLAAIITSLSALAGTFVYSTVSRRRERQAKRPS